jgi:hypothetical protein
MPAESVAKVIEAKKEEPNPNEIVVDLTVAVQAHGETIKKLKFRKPTGGDIMQAEVWPIAVNPLTGQVMPVPAVMGQMMSLLAAVPPSTIKALDGSDFADCAMTLSRFFQPSGWWR